MGREWLRSSSSSSTRASSSLAEGDCEESSNAAPPGCMSGVLNYLHSHHLLFNGSSRPPQASPPLPPGIDAAHHEQLKGSEAPRNSLELDEGIKAMSASMEDEFYDVPVAMEISSTEGKWSSQQQVETPRSTPGIVAHLMGLEISPDHASSPTLKMTPPPPPPSQLPRVMLGSKKKNRKSFDGDPRWCAMPEHDSPSPRQPLRSLDCNAAAAASSSLGFDGAGSCSLPETPKVSLSSARRSSELDKENYMTTTGECHPLRPPQSANAAVKTKKRDSGKQQDENKSPRSRHYSRDIVEQVKENITTSRGDGGRPDEIKYKSKRTRRTTAAAPPSPHSLQLKKTDEGAKTTSETTKMILNKCKKADSVRFTERIVKRQQTRAPTTLASLFLSARENSNPGKNRSRPAVSTASSVNLNLPSTRSSTSTLGFGTRRSSDQNKGRRRCRSWKSYGPEFRYIKSIFERAGISGLRSLRRSSPFMPIDLIVFDELELELPLFTGHLRFRWNRKPVFHLAEEILGDLLLGCSEHLSPSSAPTTASSNDEEALLRRVWGHMRSFPAEGNVDLYALISRDLPEGNVRRLLRHPSEEEDVAFKVEGEILDGLVGEAAAALPLSLSQHTPLFPAAVAVLVLAGIFGGTVDALRHVYCACNNVMTHFNL